MSVIDEKTTEETKDQVEFHNVEISCTSAQREVITTKSSPNCLLNVISGPGTGKSKTICNRIAYLLSEGMEPSQIMVFSLTNKCIEDLRKTLVNTIGEQLASCIHISTIHSLANSIVTQNSSLWNITRDRKFINSKVFNSILQKLTINQSSRTEYLEKLDSKQLARLKIENPQLYGKYLGFEYSGDITPLRSKDVIYDKMIHEATVLLKMHNMKEDNDKEKVKENESIFSISSNIADAKEIIVDEFQDLTGLTLDFILELSKNKHLTISGDLDQSIYSFQGVNSSENIEKIKDIYLQKGYQIKEQVLDETFRFGEDIMKVALNLLGTKYSLIKEVVNEESLPVVRKEFATSIDEFQFIYDEINSLIKYSNGMLSPKNFAVLGYTNHHLDLFKKFYDNKGSKNTTKRLKTLPDWLDSKLSTVLTFLKLLDNPHDDASMFVAINFLPGVGPKTLESIQKRAESLNISIFELLKKTSEFEKKINRKFLEELGSILNDLDRNDPTSITFNLIRICTHFNFSKHISDDNNGSLYTKILKELYENFKVLLILKPQSTNLLTYFLTHYESDFLTEVDMKSVAEKRMDDFISLSTIHTAKGMEWDIVFVLTHLQEFTQYQHDISSRTNYVAATRAKHLLYFNKSVWDKILHADTSDKSAIKFGMNNISYHDTIVDYFPNLKNCVALNNLDILPKFGKPIGINADEKGLAKLLSNISKRNRSQLHVNVPIAVKKITKLCRSL